MILELLQQLFEGWLTHVLSVVGLAHTAVYELTDQWTDFGVSVLKPTLKKLLSSIET